MILTEQQINTFCKVFNLDKSALQRKYIFDVNESTLEEFLSCNFVDDNFEKYLYDYYIQQIVNMNINDEYKNRLDFIDVKRIS
jgi:hypothetical protein